MVSAESLARIAYWSVDLTDEERLRAARGISEKVVAKGAYICHLGDRLDCWVGVSEGLLKLSTVTRNGKAMTFAGIAEGGWFGEGSLIKNEPRRYDVVALRDCRLALMDRPTFQWLFEHSVGFNRFLVRHFNERLSQFMAQVEFDRTLNATERLARSISWLYNPVFYPYAPDRFHITQEEIGLLCGLSRQSANRALQQLEGAGLLVVEGGQLRVRDIDGLRCFELPD